MSLQKLDLDIQMPCFLSKSCDNDVVGALSFSPGNSAEMSLDGFPFKGQEKVSSHFGCLLYHDRLVCFCHPIFHHAFQLFAVLPFNHDFQSYR